MAQVIGAVIGATGNSGQKDNSTVNTAGAGQTQISNAGAGTPTVNTADVKEAATNEAATNTPTEAKSDEAKSNSPSIDTEKWKNLANIAQGLTQSGSSQNVSFSPTSSGGSVANFR